MENESDFLKRRGSFRIAYSLLVENPEETRQVLSHVLIVKAENSFMTDAITYYGYSEMFDSTEDACAPPEYTLIVTRGQDGKLSDVKAERIR